jgi:hypothetical protein
MNVNSFAIVTILSGFLGGQCGHQFDDSLLSLGRHALDFFGVRAPGIGPEADAILEEDGFEGPGFIGFVGGSGELFPGIIGFGIPDPEDEAMPVPVDELIGLGGFGGGVKAAELEFLNLLHIDFFFELNSFFLRY